jgi:hypothetical protein
MASIPAASSFVEGKWPVIQQTLEDYIRIPNQSPMFDPEHLTNGFCAQVVALFTSWVEAQALPGLSMEVISEAGRTPLIYIEVASTGGEGTVLLYVR